MPLLQPKSRQRRPQAVLWRSPLDDGRANLVVSLDRGAAFRGQAVNAKADGARSYVLSSIGQIVCGG